MAVEATELFYSYTHEDESFLNKLNNHLASLKRLGLITTWHHQEIKPGSISSKERRTGGGESGKRDMARTPQSIDKAFLKKAVNQYFIERHDYEQVVDYELGLRSAFQNLLASVAKHIGWSLAPEKTLGKIRP